MLPLLWVDRHPDRADPGRFPVLPLSGAELHAAIHRPEEDRDQTRQTGVRGIRWNFTHTLTK